MSKSDVNDLIAQQRRLGKKAGFIIGMGKGLSLKVSDAGSTTFITRFKWQDKVVSLKLGDYPQMTEEEARAALAQCKQWRKEGSDPRQLYRLTASKPHQPEAYTVADMVNDWLSRSRRASIDSARQAFERHILPHAGAVRVDDLDVSAWITLLDAVATGKHTGRPAPSVARKLLADIKAAMQYARLAQKCESRTIDDIPADFIAADGKPGDRVLSVDELRDVLRWTTTSSAPSYYRNLTRLLVVFGARTAEFRLSELKEWNLEAATWTVPAAHSKNGNEIVRPIPDPIMPLITELVRRARAICSPYLLGELKAQDTVSQYMGTVCEKLKHERWTAHDLRRSMRTHAADLGIMPYVAEMLLGHKVKGVEGIYNRAQLITEKRQALVAWTAELNKIERAGLFQLATVNDDRGTR